MDFAPLTPRRQIRESVVPMINVVFLLLIFFLMSAQIAPPDPVSITPPMAQYTDQPLTAGDRVAWLDAEGLLYAQGVTGAQALSVLSADPGPLILRADAAMPAALFARVLHELGAAGLDDVTLVAISGAP